MPVADAHSGGTVWTFHPYGNARCCYLKKRSAERGTETQKQHSGHAACVYLSRGISRGPGSTM